MAVVSDPVRKQVDQGQIGVDFFACLLYGHIVVALIATGTLVAEQPRYSWSLLTGIVGPLALAPIWYRLAVETTDQWASAVQALVDLGRQPLAAALGLRMPDTFDEERAMWELVSRFSSREYGPERAKSLDEYRE